MIAGIAAAVLLTGCQQPENPNPVVNSNVATNKLAGAPQWVLMPELEGAIVAVGSASESPAGIQFQRTEAIANARNELARQLSVKVENLYTGFTQVTGVGQGTSVDKTAKDVAKQVASQVLNGSKLKNTWMAPNGDLHVMVAIDATAVKAATKEAVKTSFKNDEAAWQQFQAKKGMDELDAAVEKMVK